MNIRKLSGDGAYFRKIRKVTNGEVLIIKPIKPVLYFHFAISTSSTSSVRRVEG